MLFTVVLQNYIVLHTRSTMQALYHFEDGEEQFYVNFADENDGQLVGLFFDIGAEVVISDTDPSSFTVKDIDGDEIQFNAYTPANLTTPNVPRAINTADVRMEVTEPNRLWVKVGKFDVLLNHTDEGIAVDIWPWVEPDAAIHPDEPLASCYAFDTEADEALEGPQA